MFTKRLFWLRAALTVLVLVGQICTVYADEGGSGGVIDALAELTKKFVSGAIAVAALLLAIGIVTNFVAGQFMVTAGQPYGLSATWLKIAGMIICFIGAALTITIANTIIDAISGHISTEPIHIPAGG